MDVSKLLNDLRDERDRIDAAIRALETVRARGPASAAAASKRGRKKMSAEERKIVSERMRRYWAGRKKTRKSTS